MLTHFLVLAYKDTDLKICICTCPYSLYLVLLVCISWSGLSMPISFPSTFDETECTILGFKIQPKAFNLLNALFLMSGLFSLGLGSVMRAVHKLRAESLKWPLSCLKLIEKIERNPAVFFSFSFSFFFMGGLSRTWWHFAAFVCVPLHCGGGWKGNTSQVGLLQKSPGTCRLEIFQSALRMSLTFQQQHSPKHKVAGKERNKRFANSRAHCSVCWSNRAV